MPTGQTRVALIASSFYPHIGGVEEHVRQIARELRDLGHEVVVWTVDRGEHLGVRTVDGVTVRYLPTPLPAARAGSLARFARAAPAAWRAWRNAPPADRPDPLHVHRSRPNGVSAAPLAARCHVPVVVTSHGETFMDVQVFEDSALLRTTLRKALAMAAAVTGVSEVVVADLRERFGLVHGAVIGNGVPPAPLEASEPGPGTPDPTLRSVQSAGSNRLKASICCLTHCRRCWGPCHEPDCG
ncbi:MAG: glycosyltransferase family 4 protein [Tetrasphaera sp.]|nr:glycosyltransferase family 4 protein [Tetrasphaera sp.]